MRSAKIATYYEIDGMENPAKSLKQLKSVPKPIANKSTKVEIGKAMVSPQTSKDQTTKRRKCKCKTKH